MTDESAIRAHRRVSCCEFHGVDCHQGRDCPDRPVATPESSADALELAIGILAAAVCIGVLMIAAWPVIVFAIQP